MGCLKISENRRFSWEDVFRHSIITGEKVDLRRSLSVETRLSVQKENV